MADFSSEDLKRALTEALKESGRDLNFDAKDLAKIFENLAKLDKQVSANKASMGGLFKEMLTGRRVYKDLTSTIEQLDEQIEELADKTDEASDELRKQLIQQRQHTQTIAEENAKRKAVVEGLTQFSKTMVGVTGRTMGNFAKGLQDNSDAFSLAGGVMEGAIDSMNAGAQAVGGGMSTVGSTMMMSTNPRVKALGLAATVAGGAIGFLGDSAAATGKFIVNFMVKEIQKTVEAFNKTSAAGAMFANGMTGMRDAAYDSGLTVKQFGEVVSRNSASLAQSGLGVADGAKQIGRVGKIMKDTGIQDSLLKLGYGFEEQADLTAETIARMRRTVGGKVTDQEVATQTQKYAENLRIIAAITGEDAKKKVAQVAEQNQILAFQQQLAGKSKEQRAEIDAAMALMTEQEKKNFRDRVIVGDVINKEGAIYESMVSGAREKGEKLLDLWNSNNMTTATVGQANAEFGDQINKSVLAQKDFGIAAYAVGGVIGDVSKSMLDAVNQNTTQTKEAVEAAKENVAKQKEANDKLTEGVVEASKQAQKLATDLEKLVLPRLGEFSKFSGEILEEIRKQLIKFAGEPGSARTGPSTWDKVKAGAAKGLEWGMTGATVGGVGGTVFPVVGNTVGAIGGGIIGLAGGFTKGYMEAGGSNQPTPDATPKAFGGPVYKGRTSLVGERGPELFKPKFDGDIITNEQLKNMGRLADNVQSLIDSMALTSSPTQSVATGTEKDLTSVLDNYGKVAAEQLKTTKELLAYTRENVDILNRLYNVST